MRTHDGDKDFDDKVLLGRHRDNSLPTHTHTNHYYHFPHPPPPPPPITNTSTTNHTTPYLSPPINVKAAYDTASRDVIESLKRVEDMLKLSHEHGHHFLMGECVTEVVVVVVVMERGGDRGGGDCGDGSG